MTIVESITNDLNELPNSKLVDVARYVRDLVPEASRRQRKALDELHGTISDESAKALNDALAESDA
ncbi:MAG: hypothetical protein AAGA58_16140 [Verrucomicrobiota bacterium]